MMKKNHKLEIDENEIFKNDKLERKCSIENLSSLIESTTSSFVLSIDADWGSGKTTFVRLWQEYLKKEKKINSIYFSAWEDDFSKEPLISILGEIKKYIDENFNTDLEVVESFKKVKEFGGKVLKRGVPAFLKVVTGGMLDFEKGFEDAIGVIAESTAEELIDKYSNDKEITEKFKESINKLLSKIDNTKPFVIFIDELDRCRPLYAIELLERIKHIFGIDGLIFVLSIDTKQLSESIKSQYGNIDTTNYLRRFIDMKYKLNNPSIDKFCRYLYDDIYKIDTIIKLKMMQTESDSYNDFKMLLYLVQSLNLSLREIEQIFTKLEIIFKTIESGKHTLSLQIIIILVVMQMKFTQEYESLKNKTITEQSMIDLLIMKNGDNQIERYLKITIEAVILAVGKSDDELGNLIKEKNDILNDISNEEEKKNQKRLVDMLRYSPIKAADGWRLNNAIEAYINKIDFADRFNFD